MWEFRPTSELCHYGVKGMKWGVRRYQNKDGTLTSAGRKRQGGKTSGVRKTSSDKRQKTSTDKRQKQALNRKQRTFEKKVEKGWIDTYNRTAAKYAPELDRFNDSFGAVTDKNRKAYYRAISDKWMDAYKKELIKEFGKRPIDNGEDWVSEMPMMKMFEEW